MAKSEGQKLKLFRLYDILMQESDEEHLLSRADIERHLLAYGIEIDKKTFYTDMEAIEEYAGEEMIREAKGKKYRYGVPETYRDFKLSELKLLIDSVSSAKFLTEEQSRSFIRKLEKLCSKHEGKQLHRQTCIAGRTRTEQKEVFDSVDVLNRAIDEDRQVNFYYFNWDVNKNKEYHHNKKLYRVSPWALTWDDGKYYLIGDDMDVLPENRGVRHYRVDKMENVAMTQDCRSFCEEFSGLNQSEYNRTIFNMFSGKEKNVTLVCANRKAGIIIDRFGFEQMLHREDKDHFRTTVKVVDSDQFYAWVISLGSDIRIVGPESALEKIREITKRLRETYE